MAAVAASAPSNISYEDNVIMDVLSDYYLNAVRFEPDPDAVKFNRGILMWVLNNTTTINKKYNIITNKIYQHRHNYSPLDVAVEAGDLELIKYLLDSGAKLILNDDEHAIEGLLSNYFGRDKKYKEELIALLAIGLVDLPPKDVAEILARHMKHLKENFSNNLNRPITDEEISQFFEDIPKALARESRSKRSHLIGAWHRAGTSGGARTRGRSRKAKTRRVKSRKQ